MRPRLRSFLSHTYWRAPGLAALWRRIAALFSLGAGLRAWANPVGLTVQLGSATSQAAGAQLNVTVGQTTFLNWSSFNIQPGETTTFLQPSVNSLVFNNISGAAPSQIWGSLKANGTVILADSRGFYFGPNSMIQVGGSFVATTAPLAPDLGAASAWQFTGLPPLASIVNYGAIQTGPGHSLYLIAEQIQNHGRLTAPGGTAGLLSGEEVLVSERPDGRGLSAAVSLPSGSIDNSGRITADAGAIALRAQVVNQDGILQANSVRARNGVVELVAGSQLNLGPDSQILAEGGDAPGSPGGRVTLQSGGAFSDLSGSRISAAGGPQGGTGGTVEISAPNILSLASSMDAGARPGWLGGQLLLDPAEIVLSSSGGGDAGNGTIQAGDSPATLQLNVATAFLNKNFSQITLQASDNITFAPGTVWNLSASTGLNAGQLLLQAGNNIVFGNNSGLQDANAWSVNLQAGVDFSSGQVKPGVGSILLNGGAGQTFNGFVQTAAGSVAMTAGQDILVGTGAITTVGGGAIQLQALAGEINAGTKNDGYVFTIQGAQISPNGLGGIATAAGGDVSLSAGQDVISVPVTPAGQPPGASGAYGAAPGNVTVTAGGSILGNFLVCNGTGTLLAGVTAANGQVTQILNPSSDIGAATQPVSLSLIAGSWNLFAGGDLYLNEIRNPNGVFNPSRLVVPAGEFPGNLDDSGFSAPPSRSSFLFNYAPDASASLWAGNSITLEGQNLPRVVGQDQTMPAVYPPQLSLNAGAGGINVENSLVLYPSSQGSLTIVTRDGGGLQGAPQQSNLTGITMSASGLPDFNTFASGHAATPLHLNDPNPVVLNLAGDINNFALTVPTFAHVQVAGNAYNFGFVGQNLSPSQATTITVAGSLSYRGDLTSVTLPGLFPAVLLNPALSADAEVSQKLGYDPVAGVLTFIGPMTAAELGFLLHPSQIVVDVNGQPVLDANGVPLTTPVSLSAPQQTAIQQLYAASQSASLGDWGLSLAGPGQFNIQARDADLGISGGISVLPPPAALAPLSPYGASLSVNVAGNLDMTATKISNGGLLGSIDLRVGGALDVGGELTTFGDPNAPKGVFTTSGGAVTVVAGGDVNVDGSRIAAYNGGDVSVTSQNGDINAGAGGAGYVSLSSLSLDPATGALTATPASIPGSGILATTLFGTSAQLGNISVAAPNGSINASLGGVTQIAFNNASTENSFVQLQAGQNINASGSGVIGANLRVTAGGNITGVLVGSRDVDIHSLENVSVTAFAGGSVTINSAGAISGSVVGGSSVSVSGEAVTASLVSKSISTSGDTSSAAIGVPASNAPKTAARVDDDTDTINTPASNKNLPDEDEKKKKGRPISLSRKVSRVTVILPEKGR